MPREHVPREHVQLAGLVGSLQQRVAMLEAPRTESTEKPLEGPSDNDGDSTTQNTGYTPLVGILACVTESADYLGDGALQYDVLSHVNVRRCPIQQRHTHVECAYCDRRFILNLEMFDAATAQRVHDHALVHRR